MSDDFSILNKTKGRLPSLPFVLMKEDILGKDFSLSLAFINSKEMRMLNKKHRNIDKATNILSFPLSKKSGEIIICPSVVKKETANFNKTFRQLLGFLVIHGMLHLKGMEHSSKMERAEEKYDKKYFSRN
ncbi:MAG TPA: rRNA maturation RNase YbeY [Candidatus Paceibacterota bacterium]|nr:rRNA maturation RNase YbeY [Candidatus Paceibacterota bacterium]HPT17832.1 rRNA maturation RNase YbeY [Candidatus Paceibacterota bacterium]